MFYKREMSATQKVKAAAEKRRQAVAKRELERKEAARKAALEVSWGSCELSMKLRAPHHASIPFLSMHQNTYTRKSEKRPKNTSLREE